MAQERLRRLFESFQFANTFNITPSRPLSQRTMLRVAIGHLYSTFQFCFICAKDWALKLQLPRECIRYAFQITIQDRIRRRYINTTCARRKKFSSFLGYCLTSIQIWKNSIKSRVHFSIGNICEIRIVVIEISLKVNQHRAMLNVMHVNKRIIRETYYFLKETITFLFADTFEIELNQRA